MWVSAHKAIFRRGATFRALGNEPGERASLGQVESRRDPVERLERQRDLARVQAQAIRELDLPRWMYVYALGRHAYAYVPPGVKRLVRRGVVGSRERDV